MSGTLKTSNLQHKDSADPNIQLYADGSTSIRNLQNLANNLLQNGAMTVHQRTASQTNVGNVFGYYVQDRWKIAANGGPSRFTMSNEADAPAGFSRSLKMTTTTAGAIGTNQYVKVYQPIEAQNCQLLNFGSANARTISLSFWVKSSVTGTYNLNAFCQDDNRRYAITYTIDTANTWEYKSLVIPGDTGGSIDDDNGYGLSVDFVLAAGSGFTSNNQNGKWINDDTTARHFGQGVDLGATNGQTWQVTGVQLTATDAPIEFQHEDYGTTLAKCQRYFFTIRGNIFTKFASVYTNNAGGCYLPIALPVSLRALPELTFNNIALARSGQNMSIGDLNATSFGGSHVSFDFGSAYGIPNESSDVAQLRESNGTFNLSAEL